MLGCALMLCGCRGGGAGPCGTGVHLTALTLLMISRPLPASPHSLFKPCLRPHTSPFPPPPPSTSPLLSSLPLPPAGASLSSRWIKCSWPQTLRRSRGRWSASSCWGGSSRKSVWRQGGWGGVRCSGLYNPSHTDLPYSIISHCYSRIVFDTCVSSYHKQVQHLLTSKFDTLIPHFVCAGGRPPGHRA